MELSSHHRSISLFSGETQSRYRGSGTEYAEWRLYSSLDDARNIDWKATARVPFPIIRQYESSRELKICIVLDLSPSFFFSVKNIPGKSDHLAHMLEQVLDASRAMNHSIGLVSGDIFIPCKSGKNHIEYIRTSIEHAPEKIQWNIETLIESIEKQRIENTLLLFFTDSDRSEWLERISTQNDCIYIHISHVVEEYPEQYTDIGLIAYGKKSGVLSGGDHMRYRDARTQKLAQISENITRSGASFWRTYSTEEDWEMRWNYFMRTR